MENMDRIQQLRLLALSAAVALTACGGGGGDAPAPAPAAPAPAPAAPAPAPAPGAPAPAPAPGAPAPAPSPSSGLTDPTGTLTVSLGQAGTLVSKAREAYNASAGGFAAVNLGAMSAGIGGASGSVNCPDGGSATYTAGATGGAYVYNACNVNGVLYNGSAAVTFTLNGSTLSQYSIGQTNVTANVGGQAINLDDRVDCSLVGTDMVCVGHYANNQWGNDFAFNAGTASGSYQCECNADRWTNVFSNMTATGGTVNTQAQTGSAVITRTGANTWTVTITNGSTSTYNVTL
jgi:hypothetical protein